MLMRFVSVCLTLITLLAPSLLADPVQHDIVILGGMVIDGTGNPGIYTDVAIDDGDITVVGPLRAAVDRGDVTAEQVIDATGRVVCPGFIDVHTHADESLLQNRRAENFTRDGVTSVVTGNCGGSYWPTAEFFASIEEDGSAVNVATLVGHNTVRRRVVGREDVDATPEQMEEMEQMVDQAMREGAVGLSTGLIYIPGTYTETEEIVDLARVVARHGGLYASHMRSEREGIFAAIDEALRVGREAGIPVEISHFKIGSPVFFNDDAYPEINDILGTHYAPGDIIPAASRATIAHVMRARAQGQDVTLDQYPYTASSTGIGVMIPDWVRADGDDHACELLSEQESHDRAMAEIVERYTERGYDNLDWAQIASCRSDSSLNGLSVHEATIARGNPNPTMEDEVQTVFDIFCDGGAGMVYHSMAEDDVIRIMQNPHVMICSDSGVREFGEGVPHPRGYGSNARVLGRYVRGLGVITLEDAIRKMTSLPAQRFAMRNRGLLREGFRADVVVFDPETVIDMATFTQPHQYSRGFDYVLVNGVPVVADGETTGTLPGEPIRGHGYWEPAEEFEISAPRMAGQ